MQPKKGKKIKELKEVRGVSLDLYVTSGIDELAKKQSRNFSNLVNLILRNFLEAKQGN